jgi:DUF4097 and DUF4098 domain-containing protein YvlB
MSLPKSAWFVTVALVLAGCSRTIQVTKGEQVTKEFAAAAAPRIVVDTFNGSIHAERGVDNQVRAVITKVGSGATEADAQADLANIEITALQEGNTIRITAKRAGDLHFGNSEASVDVTVPASSGLELMTSNGGLDSHGISGSHKLRTSNGAIAVAGAKGELTAESSNGAISLDAQDAMVHAEASNGRIAFQGSLAPGKHTFRSANGAVEITLPRDAAFTVDASAANGSVTTDFDLKTIGKKDGRILKGSIGDNPATEITASTGNGSIQIRRSR